MYKECDYQLLLRVALGRLFWRTHNIIQDLLLGTCWALSFYRLSCDFVIVSLLENHLLKRTKLHSIALLLDKRKAIFCKSGYLENTDIVIVFVCPAGQSLTRWKLPNANDNDENCWTFPSSPHNLSSLLWEGIVGKKPHECKARP